MTSVRESIDRAPMSAYQVLVVVICLAIVLAEGFDLLIMAFSASGVAQEWSLSGSEVGILLSAALFGMAFGSAFLAPLADRIGRRMQTLGCLLLVAIAMLLASFSTSFVQLGIWRVLTGLGIGGLAASLPVVVAEFSPQRRRTTMLAIYTIGLPLGGVIGGLIAGALAAYGWRASFTVGAGITFVLFLVVLFAMPESIDYLLVRRPKNALARVNKTLQWMRIAPIAELPAVEHRKDDTVKGAIFTGRNGIRSALLGFVFFVFNAGFYFATSWTPRLLEQTSQSAQQGITGGTLLNLGGAAGALLFGLLALKFRLRWLAAVTVACAALSLVAMSVTLGGPPARSWWPRSSEHCSTQLRRACTRSHPPLTPPRCARPQWGGSLRSAAWEPSSLRSWRASFWTAGGLRRGCTCSSPSCSSWVRAPSPSSGCRRTRRPRRSLRPAQTRWHRRASRPRWTSAPEAGRSRLTGARPHRP
ncbi:MFS transporter [Paenarthrobacter ureafaciens]|uniref:MFS transporter n=1 Tax=Paenarthrobacter ureafaciens TaxID=37931 RepID=UPI001C70B25E|nr:MFS transporter [Paenarthrobacter ureafaciens]